MATTVYDIARVAGVSRTTVLRALWDKHDISPNTKARIKKLAVEMDYRPNPIARSLVSGHSSFVGVMANPNIIAAVPATMEITEKILREAGYSMFFTTSGGQPGGESVCLDQLMHNRVAGIVAIPSSNVAEQDHYQSVLDSGVQIVVLDRCLPGLKVPQFVGDDYSAARVAAEHLISLGHKRIAHLAIPQTSHAGRERAKGFEDAMQEAGLRTNPAWVVETLLQDEHGASAMAQLLKRKDPPTAVIARHDITAVGAMRTIRAAGMSVPEDISVVGGGDIWCGDMLTVPLTTVHHPFERMTGLATKALLDMLTGVYVEPEITVLEVNLVVRSSSAPPHPGGVGRSGKRGAARPQPE